jgi:hypothetical protein
MSARIWHASCFYSSIILLSGSEADVLQRHAVLSLFRRLRLQDELTRLLIGIKIASNWRRDLHPTRSSMADHQIGWMLR